MNKKFYLIIILIATLFFSAFFQERANRDIQNLKIETILGDISNQDRFEFSIFNSNKQNLLKFHNEFIELAVQEKIIVKTGYNHYQDNGDKKISNYIYDPDNLYFKFIKNNFEYTGQEIDFSDTHSTAYISTDLKSKSQAKMKLFNQRYLEYSKLVYEQRCIKNFIDEYQSIDNNINYYVYLNNDKDVESIKRMLQSHFTEEQYETSDNILENHGDDYSFVLQNNYILIFFFSFSFIICMIYIFYKKYREMTIVSLLGYRIVDIFRNYFLKEITLCLFLLGSSFIVYFMIFVSRINEHTLPFLKELIVFFIAFLSIFVILVFFFIIYIFMTKKYSDISRGRSLNRVTYIQLIAKVVFMSIFVLFIIINIVPNYPYYETLNSFYNQKEIIESVYDIKNIKDDKRYSRILCENGAIACDFTDISRNTGQSGYVPYIIVNQEYLSLYDIDVGSSNPTLMIPNQYKNIDISKYTFNLDAKIQYIDDSYTFYDPSLSVISSIKNPIILAVNEEYPYLFHSLYMKNDKSIDYYKDLLSPIIDKEQIEIQQNRTYINMLLREVVYPKVLNNSLFAVIYLLTYFLMLELLVNIYLKNNEKEICIKKVLGYHYIYIYSEIILLNLLTFVIPLIIAYKFSMIQNVLPYILIIGLIDVIYIWYKTYFIKHNIKLLKEV